MSITWLRSSLALVLGSARSVVAVARQAATGASRGDLGWRWRRGADRRGRVPGARAARAGGIALLVVLAVAAALHVATGQSPPLSFAVYAAAIWVVIAHRQPAATSCSSADGPRGTPRPRAATAELASGMRLILGGVVAIVACGEVEPRVIDAPADVPAAVPQITLTSQRVDGQPINAELVAYQDGDGPWQSVTGHAGVYQFPVTTARYGLLAACGSPASERSSA